MADLKPGGKYMHFGPIGMGSLHHRARSQTSARRIEKETGDKHVATDWTPAKDTKEAFKQEAGRIESGGGKSSANNYNKIDSPGKNLLEGSGSDKNVPKP